MAKPRMDLSAFVGKLLEEQDGDVLREGIRVLSQALMETEVAGLIGAERHERSGERPRTATVVGRGRGTRAWARSSWRSRRCGRGRISPRCCSPAGEPSMRCWRWCRRRTCTASRRGRSTTCVKALGLDGMSKSEVSRICGELDPVVAAFRTRPLTGEHRYLWVDATYHKVRVDGRVISQATVVAIGVTSDGERQVLGVDVGPSEDRAFWTAFLRSLVKRGLKGVRLVISDAHEGLKQAISTVLTGSTWQRCRVHFMRNLLGDGAAGAREAIAAIVRTIFAQPDHALGADAAAQGGRGAADAVPPGRGGARRGGGGHPGVPASAAGTSAAAAQHQPAGALEQGDQAPLERRRDLSQPGGGDPAGGRRFARAGRRMGRGRAPLLQRGIDEAADDAGAVDDDAGDLGGDSVAHTDSRTTRSISTT